MGEMPENWKKGTVIPVFKQSKSQETTGQSASPPSLVRWWNNLFWMLSPSNWKRRRLSGAVNTYSPRGNHA